MSVRINVTAVRDCPELELRAAMSDALRSACAGPDCGPAGDQLDVREHGGWSWFATSVWGVSAGDLNRGLCKLARPAVQFSTSDGDRWYLTVHGGPSGQVHFLHEFRDHAHAPDPAEDDEFQARLDAPEEPDPVDPALAFLEDDPIPGPERPRAKIDAFADGLEELGANIPLEFRAAVAGLPYSAAVERYRVWHAERVSAALAEAGIAHDARAVRSVLLWENVTEAESSGDLGNLPRLLSVLGLGGEWDELVRQAEAPPQPEPEPEPISEPEPAPERQDHFGPVLALVEPHPLTPVAGGPFAVALADLTLIRFFVEALSIHDTAGVVLAVSLPAGFAGDRLVLPDDDDTVELTDAGFRLTVSNHLWFGRRDLSRQLGEPLYHLLDCLPDGSALDLAFALEDKPALTQRYRGPVAGGEWQVAETYPPLTRDALAGGMELARYAAGDPETHELRDEAEARALVELARRDPNLWDAKVQRDGRTVWCKSDVVGHLPKALFRLRYAGSWDVAAHDREAAGRLSHLLEQQQRIRRAGAVAARRRADPHDAEVVFRGRFGPYWRSDFALLTDLEQDTRAAFDAALAALGYRHLGDLVSKRQRDIVVRAFVSGDGACYGCLMAKRTMYLATEFFSRFEDGTSLTTSTSGQNDSVPGAGVYTKVAADPAPAAVHARHAWGVGCFRSRRGTEPVPLAASLAGVAQEYDRVAAARAAGGSTPA